MKDISLIGVFISLSRRYLKELMSLQKPNIVILQEPEWKRTQFVGLESIKDNFDYVASF